MTKNLCNNLIYPFRPDFFAKVKFKRQYISIEQNVDYT